MSFYTLEEMHKSFLNMKTILMKQNLKRLRDCLKGPWRQGALRQVYLSLTKLSVKASRNQ